MSYSRSPMKSVQRGVIELGYAAAGTPLTATASVTSVDTDKSIVTQGGSATYESQGGVYITDATTVTAEVYTSANSRAHYYRWELKEFF
jgi:hypothetical protein